MTRLTVGLAQMRCEKGDWPGNLARTEALLGLAAAAGCEVAIFPEAGLSGYADPSRFPQSVQPLDSPLVAQFVALTARYPLAASAGFLEENPAGKPFVTQVLAADGEIIGIYRKVEIPADDALYYAPGSAMPVFTLPLPGGPIRCALAICADSDRPDLFAAFAAGGAQVVFHSSAPGLYTRRTDAASWQDGYNWYKGYLAERLPGYARAHRLPIVVATQTGRTVDEDFPGGSFVFGPDGACLAATPDYQETLLVSTLDITDLSTR